MLDYLYAPVLSDNLLTSGGPAYSEIPQFCWWYHQAGLEKKQKQI